MAMWISIVCPTAWNHIEVCEPCCWYPGPYWCGWPVLPSEAKLMCVVWAVSEDLVLVCGPMAAGDHVRILCCGRKPSGGPWSVHLLTVKSKEDYVAMILVMADTQLRRYMESFCEPLPPTTHKGNSLRRKPLKRTLKKKCAGDTEE